jgi:hypothetical protein
MTVSPTACPWTPLRPQTGLWVPRRIYKHQHHIFRCSTMIRDLQIASILTVEQLVMLQNIFIRKKRCKRIRDKINYYLYFGRRKQCQQRIMFHLDAFTWRYSVIVATQKRCADFPFCACWGPQAADSHPKALPYVSNSLNGTNSHVINHTGILQEPIKKEDGIR